VSYPVLAPVSEGYPKDWGRLLTCYSPVRRSSTPKGLSARLACVKHAASVRPEPGSNSPTKTWKTCPDNKKLPKESSRPQKADQEKNILAPGLKTPLLISKKTPPPGQPPRAPPTLLLGLPPPVNPEKPPQNQPPFHSKLPKTYTTIRRGN